ncbi:hypothetical protein [Novosphingobium resinovorum]|uniref:hypothetical protein n=1 Tax=Novosphingobium resinovorum TaxID=158500 RepID=UPI002ED5EB21|nr:hypothetical protein [Novosphingobium resinovorum]
MTDEFTPPTGTGGDITAQRQILPPARIDDVAEAVLALARELWVVADRQIVTEALLARHGITAADIDAFQPDAETEARLDTRRRQIVDNLLVALKAG